MKKEKFRSIETNELVMATRSGSVRLSTDDSGKIKFGAITAPGVSEAFVIDPINNEVRASKIKFPDGSSFDSAINLDDINLERTSIFLLKANKIFFKYDGNGNAIPDQTITLTFDTDNIIDLTPTIEFVPSIADPPTLSGTENTLTFTVEQFELFNSDEVEIKVTIGNIADSVTIYKVQDGVTYLQGGLTNPVSVLQTTYDSNGNVIIENKSEVLAAQGGRFVIFKDGQDITGNPRITYRLSTDAPVTDGLDVTIDSDGYYKITSFDETKEVGLATFVATDTVSGQTFDARYSISITKQGAQGAQGPTGATGASGNDAKTVTLTYTDGQIAYDSEGKNPVTNKQDGDGNYVIELEANESDNHEGTITYEFWITEPESAPAILQRGSNSKLILTNTDKTFANGIPGFTYKFIEDTKDEYGGGKIITVKVYEGDNATATSQDQTKIIATKDGSDSLSINLENASHTFPADPIYVNGNLTGYNVTNYEGGGSIVEVYFGNEELTGNTTATSTDELQNGEFRVEKVDQENITAATSFGTKEKTVAGQTKNYFYINDPTDFTSTADTASIAYLVVGKSSTGAVKSGLAKISYTKSKKGDIGPQGSSGSSVKAVKLTSNDYQIAYDASGKNPNPSTITLTAAASNHEGTVTYKFYRDGTEELSSGTSNTYTTPTTGDDSIPATKFSKYVYSVKTFEGSNEIATDSITVFATKDGEGAVTIIVPNNNHTFNADSEGNVTSFAGGGSEIQVYFGNTECQGTLGNSLDSNFSFRVSDVATSNITLPTPNIEEITGKHTLKLKDPTALGGSNGTVTLSIEVRGDSNTTQTFTQVCSYNKSQDGRASVDQQIYSFSKTTEINSVKRALGWKSTTTSDTTTNTNSYRNYKGDFTYSNNGIVINSPDASYGGSLLELKARDSNDNLRDGATHIFSDFIPVNTNLTYKLKRRFKTNSTDFRMYIGFYKEDKTWIKNSGFSAINTSTQSNVWIEQTVLITGQQKTDSEILDLADGSTTFFAYTNDGETVKYVRLFIWLQNLQSSGEEGYVDYYSLEEAKADLDGNGGLPSSQLTKDRDSFYFTDDGKLRIGLSRAGTVKAADGNFFDFLDNNPDIQIIAGTTTNDPFSSGFPDINFTNPNVRGFILGKIGFSGFNGVIYDNNNDDSVEIPPDEIEIGERCLIVAGQLSFGGLAGIPYMGFANAAQASAQFHPPSTPRTTPDTYDMFITNGRVCIGPNSTIDADYTLRVKGNAKFDSGITSLKIDEKNGYVLIQPATTANTPSLIINKNGTTAQITTTNDELVIDAATAGTGVYLNRYVNKNTVINSGGGNVGIGIELPAYKLDVNGIIAVGGVPVINTQNTPNDIYVNARVIRNRSGNSTYQDGMYIGYGNTGAANGHLRFYANNTTERMRITADNGYVGIGRTQPGSPLEIFGGTNDGNGGLRIRSADALSYWNLNVGNGGDDLYFSAAGVNKAYIDNDSAKYTIVFTGQHRNKTDELLDISSTGLIVVSTGFYDNLDRDTSPMINESLPKVKLSTQRNQKSVFGVISNKEDFNEGRLFENGSFVTINNIEQEDERLIINSVGEGGIWVTNINGNLENGDYITTCEIPGYGMKQDDDLLHNYTVAKITCDCDFDLESPIYICEEFQWEDNTYRRAFVGCTYHCG